jgi:chromate reductase, NAD(P)H dehydrogenase (quinone)
MLYISGSLRAGSTNSAVLLTAVDLAPDGIESDMYQGLADLPAFNPDDDHEPLPEPVAALRNAVHNADAILFCTPEYAGALPGSLKNLLDWLIGDEQPRSIYEKAVGWINSSPRGAEGAHQELRTVMTYTSANIVEPACIRIPVTREVLGADGLLSSDESRIHLADAIAALEEVAQRHSVNPAGS